jgi:hypothetical protein
MNSPLFHLEQRAVFIFQCSTVNSAHIRCFWIRILPAGPGDFPSSDSYAACRNGKEKGPRLRSPYLPVFDFNHEIVFHFRYLPSETEEMRLIPRILHIPIVFRLCSPFHVSDILRQ